MRRRGRQLGIWALGLLPTTLVSLPGIGLADAPLEPARPRRVYADAFTVWIYEKPERSLNPIGMLRAGQSVPLRSDSGRPAHQRVASGCGKGWYAVEPTGFVCLDHQLSLSPTRYSESMATLLPRSGAFPFEYALSMGTTSYRRLPSEAEWQRRERKYGPAGPRPLPPHWRGHEQLVSDLQLDLGKLSPFLERGGSVSRLEETRLTRREVPFGSMLAFSGAFEHEGRHFAQSADGTVVGLDRMRRFRRSEFSGVELREKDSRAGRLGLPLAWPRRQLTSFRLSSRGDCRVDPPFEDDSAMRGDAPRRSGAVEPQSSSSGRLATEVVNLPAGCLEATTIQVEARVPLPLDNTRIVIAGTEFLRFDARRAEQRQGRSREVCTDGPCAERREREQSQPSAGQVEDDWLLLPREALFLAEQRSPPSPIAKAEGTEKWIHFNIEQGTLTAYRGRRPWFTTLASPGSGGVPARGADPLDTRTTPVGSYRIHFKYLTDDMSPEVGEHRSYWLADVPYAMYFKQPFAIHVAYWHEAFGEPMSGGCINVSPRDGERLFRFADPPLPTGWYGVGVSSTWGLGTWVVIDRN